MRKLTSALVIACGLLTTSVPVHAATVVFSDTFNSYAPTLNWNGSGVWSTGNSVDLVQSGTFGLTCVGGTGNCVDLSGSTPGFTSKSLVLDPGTYLLEFDYTGNQLGAEYPAAGFNVSFGSFSQFVGPLSNASAAFTHFAQYVNVAGSPTALSFNQVGGDNYRGSILDNVSISAVPEPATWLTMLLGFGIIGFGMRRRRTSGRVAFA